MNFAQFVELPDKEKLIIIEIQPTRELQEGNWENPPSGYSNCYSILFTAGEVVKVTINGNELTEFFSISDCDSNSSSFYYDPWNQNLYVHTPDSDDPGTTEAEGNYKYCIIAYFWIGICNDQRRDNQVDYERQENVLEDGGFELWNSATDLKKYSEYTTGSSTVNRDNSETYDENSAYSVRLDVDSSNSTVYVSQSIKLYPGGKCRIKFYYKNSAAGKTARIRLYDSGLNVYLNSTGNWTSTVTHINLPNSTTWAEYEIEFLAHKDYSNYIILFWRDAATSSSIYYDYAELWRYRLPIHYKPQLSEESIPAIYQAVGDYYIADERIQFGTLLFTNSAWWYEKRQTYNFHNKEMLIKVGAIGSDYEDLETIFTGVSKRPKIYDEKTELDMKDPREKDFQMIPKNRFDTTTYPNLDTRYENMVIPILFGKKTNISPVCINKTSFIYKISQTVWGGTTYPLQAINAVYKDGVTLATPADYSVDLNNGQFTLVNDPANALITCDAQGICCDLEDGSYSDNVADIWHFILTVLNGIPEERLNLASFLDLKSGRTWKIGKYLSVETETLELGKELKRSAIFQSFPLLNGKYIAKYYVEGTEDDTPRFRNEDYHFFAIEEDTESAIKTVIVKYDQDPTNGESWKYVVDDYDNTEWRHGEKGTHIIETALTVKAEAETLRDFYMILLQDPANRLTAKLSRAALNLNPTDKAFFTKIIKNDKDEDIIVIEDEVYRILDLTKNISDGLTDVIGLKDIQSVGYYSHSDHTDGPHQDYNDHVDGAHSDSPHEDEHTDSHGDTHGDGAHDDVAHEDEHTDDHGDVTHEDTPHQDSHEDVPHEDGYNDHTDVPLPHEDGHDDVIHEDYHEDVPHEDTPHEDTYEDDYWDSHGDSAHLDTHTDTYTDEHTDVPHSDSYP